MGWVPPAGAGRSDDPGLARILGSDVVRPVLRTSIAGGSGKLAPGSGSCQIASFLSAVLGYLPVLGTWWNQDDWGLLARAAGLLPQQGWPARWLSQTAYWSLLYPLAHLDPDPYTWTRLLLHGGCAVLVVRIAARAGLGTLAQLVAGLLFAVGAPAFTPLYWASGVQELLGGFFALLALERWLAGGRRNLVLAGAAGLLSFLAKENGLGLPILLAALLLAGGERGTSRRARWLMVGLLAIAAAGEAVLVWRHFDHGPDRPYGLGGGSGPLVRLAGYGWCLLARPGFIAPRPDLARALAGATVWLLWLAVAVLAWRRGRRLPAATLLAALLSLAPVLPLATHLHPYYLYLPAAAGALALACLLPARWTLRPAPGLALVAVATLAGLSACELRLKLRDPRGQPVDPMVLRTAISYRACRQLEALAASPHRPPEVLLLQIPPASLSGMATRLGEGWVTGSVLHTALGGSLGPRLLLDERLEVRWVNGLQGAPAAALVLAEGGPLLLPWGSVPQALLYLSLTEVARGLFDRAERHLARAARLGGPNLPIVYDPDNLPVTAAQVQQQAAAFRSHLQNDTADLGGIPPAALISLWEGLLQVCLQDARS